GAGLTVRVTDRVVEEGPAAAVLFLLAVDLHRGRAGRVDPIDARGHDAGVEELLAVEAGELGARAVVGDVVDRDEGRGRAGADGEGAGEGRREGERERGADAGHDRAERAAIGARRERARERADGLAILARGDGAGRLAADDQQRGDTGERAGVVGD